MGHAGVGSAPAGGSVALSIVKKEYGAYMNSNSPGTLLSLDTRTWFSARSVTHINWDQRRRIYLLPF